MDILIEVLLGLLSFVFAIGMLAAFVKMAPFIMDGKFGPEGVDVVILGGSLRVFRLKRENIREAIILKRKGLLRIHFERSEFNTGMIVRMLNRWQDTAVVIKTTGVLWWGTSRLPIRMLRLPNSDTRIVTSRVQAGTKPPRGE